MAGGRRPFDAGVLELADGWGAGRWGVAVLDPAGVIAERGQPEVALPWASVTKLVTAYLTLIAVARGVVALADAAGPPGSTIRHLLAHASGLGFEGSTPVSPPERTRIYSNVGFDTLGAALTVAAGRPFAQLLRTWVLDPLAMTSARLEGPPSQGMSGTLLDLEAFALELLRPRILPASVLADATAVAFAGLRGVLPGFGLQDPLDWGLGFEPRDAKSPHWMGTRNSPRAFGHFGGSGTFLWVDPDAGIACVALTDRPFGPWAAAEWPAFSDAVLEAAR